MILEIINGETHIHVKEIVSLSYSVSIIWNTLWKYSVMDTFKSWQIKIKVRYTVDIPTNFALPLTSKFLHSPDMGRMNRLAMVLSIV